MTPYVEPSTNSAWVQDERLIIRGLGQAGQIVLRLGPIDVRAAIVLEHPEHPVKANVDARGSDEGLVVQIETEASSDHLGLDIAVAQQHPRKLAPIKQRGTPPQRTRR